MNEILTVNELAARWRTGRDHVLRMLGREELPYFKKGNLKLIRVEDVEDYEKANTKEWVGL